MGTVTVQQLEAAPLETARTAASIISRAAEQLTGAATTARESAAWREAGVWSGAAADAASHSLDGSINRWDAAGFAAGFAGQVSAGHVRALVSAQGVARAAASAARQAMLHVSPDGVVTAGNLRFVPGIGWAAQGLASALTAVLVGAVRLAGLMDSLSSSAVNSLRGAVEPARPSSELHGPALAAVQAVPLQVEEVAGMAPVDSPGLVGHVSTAGDLATATEIVTFVSGVGSDDAASQRVLGAWAQQQVAAAQAQGRNIAVVVWNGYDAPDSLAHAVSPLAAKVAAPELQRFQQQLRQKHPGAHLSVVGYNYGSVVVGQSARRAGAGLEADEVTFHGSPGVRSKEAAQLNLRTRPVELGGLAEPNQTSGPGNVGGPGGSGGSETPGGLATPPQVRSFHAPGDLIQLVTEPWGGIHGPDPSSPGFSQIVPNVLPLPDGQPAADPHTPTNPPKESGQPTTNSHSPANPGNSAETWSRYTWQRALDAYLLSRGERDSHSSYLWDPTIDIIGSPTSQEGGLNNSGMR